MGKYAGEIEGDSFPVEIALINSAWDTDLGHGMGTLNWKTFTIQIPKNLKREFENHRLILEFDGELYTRILTENPENHMYQNIKPLKIEEIKL